MLVISEGNATENGNDDWDIVWLYVNNGELKFFFVESDWSRADSLFKEFTAERWDDQSFRG